MTKVRWTFGPQSFPSVGEFKKALRQARSQYGGVAPALGYQIFEQRLAVRYAAWQDGAELEPVIVLETKDKHGFNAPEILWKLHEALCGANLGDKRFFEGLFVHGKLDDTCWLYQLRQGS